MDYILRCPACQAEQAETDESIGQAVQCSRCSSWILVEPPTDGDSLVLGGTVVSDDGDSGLPEESPLTDSGQFALGAPIDREAVEAASDAAMMGDLQDSAEVRARRDAADAAGDKSSETALVRWKEEPDEYDEETYQPIKLKRQADRETDMDMTPMVDVTFLLLIFFMVTASFTLHKSIEQPPQTEEEPSLTTIEDPEEELDYILVFVDEFNTFQVIYGDHDWECASEQELIVRLREVVSDTTAGATPTELLVMAHGDALHSRVVMAMDAGTTIGMAQINVTMTETGP